MSKGTKERTLKAQVRVNCDRGNSFTNGEKSPFERNLNFSCTKTTKKKKKRKEIFISAIKRS